VDLESLRNWLIAIIMVIVAIVFISKVASLKKFSIILFCITFVLGYLGYFYSYTQWPNQLSDKNSIQAGFHGLFSTIRMFTGNDDMATYINISIMPEWLITYAIPVFWVVHVLALTSTLLLILGAFGKKLMQHISLLFTSKKRLIVCRVNKDSIIFAENAIKSGRSTNRLDLVFIDENVSEKDKEAIYRMGASLVEESPIDDDGINIKGFKRAGLKLCRKSRQMSRIIICRNVEVFSFHEDEIMQYCIYKDIHNCANNISYPIDKLSIFLHVEEVRIEELIDNLLAQFVKEKKESLSKLRLYKVSTFSESQLAADCLFTKYPLIDTKKEFIRAGIIDYEKYNNKKMLLVGFGFSGKCILKSAIHLGQYVTIDPNTKGIVPTVFCVDIVDKDVELQKDYFYRECPGILEHPHLFNLNFIDTDSRSMTFTNLIKENIKAYDYIVIAQGDDEQNILTALEVHEIYNRISNFNPPILVQVREKKKDFVFENIQNMQPFGFCIDTFDYELITKHKIDIEAEEVNKFYNEMNISERKGEIENWLETSFFKRRTNRAQIEYWNANYNNMGFTNNKVINKNHLNDLGLSKDMPPIIEVMAIIEHYRWNAFHLINGWRTGCWSGYNPKKDTITKFRHEITGGKHKDEKRRLQCCIVSWEELIDVNAKFETDFFEYDRAFSFIRLLKAIIETPVNFENEFESEMVAKERSYSQNMEKFQEILKRNSYGKNPVWQPTNKTQELFQNISKIIKKYNKDPEILDLLRKLMESYGVNQGEKGKNENQNKQTDQRKKDTEIDEKEVVICDIPLELIAEKVHDAWAKIHVGEGWTWGENRDDVAKKTPCLVPYSQLPEYEKDYDRQTALATINSLSELEYDIIKRIVND
jgi:hypothetical protein